LNPGYRLNRKDLSYIENFVRDKNYDERTMRPRAAFLGDGYCYAARAVKKRWGLDYCFVEVGHKRIKTRYFSSEVNKLSGGIWLTKINRDRGFVDRTIKEMQALLTYGEDLRRLKFKNNLSVVEIRKNIFNQLKWTIKIHEFSQLWAGVDYIKDSVEEEIKKLFGDSSKKMQDIISTLSCPLKMPLQNVEERDLIRMVKMSGVRLDMAIKNHAHKYGYVVMRDISDEPFGQEYYTDRLKKIQTNKDEYEKLKDRLSVFEREIIKAGKIIKEAKIPRGLKDKIKFIRWFLYFRTEISDYFRISNGVYKPVFIEISKRFNLSLETVLNMTYKEIVDSLGGKISNKLKKIVLDRTNNGYGLLIMTPPKKSFLVTGKEVDIVDGIFSGSVDKKIKNIIGKVAFRGNVTGIARVIVDRTKANELKEGEILVTTMTGPEFFIGIKGCSGIITNEGGLTTHAAIMAREFGKPCIIGTQIATDVIKTGQSITIDGDRGMVIIND
ncbi:MAG: PEP-utilizing enzyme, partial [bacterium]